MDLGTQVFLFRPFVAPAQQLRDLTTLFGPGPGFGDPKQKYTWSGTFFDGVGGPTEELYTGTFSVQIDPVGAISAILRLSALLETDTLLGDLDLDGVDGLGGLLDLDFPKILDTDGGEIWRFNFNTQNVTRVAGPNLDFLDERDAGFREMATFDDKIFAATSGRLIFNLASASDNPAKIIYAEKGGPWMELTGGPLSPVAGPGTATTSIRSMDDVTLPSGETVLIVGTAGASGAETWQLDSDLTWKKLASLPALTHAETFQTESGDIYFGTWAPYGLFKLNPGAEPPILDVTPTNVEIDDQGVMQMIEFMGEFYITSVNYFGGTSVFKTATPMDRDSWEVVTSDGFRTDGAGNELLANEMGALGVPFSIYGWQVAVVDGTLYIGDFNNVRALLIETTDGENFSIVNDTVEFGSEAYGVRKLLPVNISGGLPDTSLPANSLIIGSADPIYTQVPLSSELPPDGIIIPPAPFPGLWLGTPREDIIFGGAFGDEIRARGDDDWVFGDLGNPLLLGGPDLIFGDDGFDRLFGNVGNDSIAGGDGEDLLVGGIGADSLVGGPDIDLILGDLTTDGMILELFGGLLGGGLPLGGVLGETAGGLSANDVLNEVAAQSEIFAANLAELAPITANGFTADAGAGLASSAERILAELDRLDVGTEMTMPDDEMPEAISIFEAIFGAFDQVIEPILGTGVEGVFEALLDWLEASFAAQAPQPLEPFFPDADIETLSSIKGAFDQLFVALADAIPPVPVPGPAPVPIVILTELEQMAAAWSRGESFTVSDELAAAVEGVLQETEGAFGEFGLFAGIDASTDAEETPGDGPATNVLGDGQIIAAIFGIFETFDDIAQQLFDQSFFEAFLDFTGLFDDTIVAGEGADIVFGGQGSDDIGGGLGPDLVYGGSGFDMIRGAADNDLLFGGNGADMLFGGPGDDFLSGGNGRGDKAVFGGPLSSYGIAPMEDGLVLSRFGEAVDDFFTLSNDGPGDLDVIGNDIISETDRVLDDVETFVFGGELGPQFPFFEIEALAGAPGQPRAAEFDTAGTRGQVTANADGTFTYDPNGMFDDLPEGETAVDSFTYTLDPEGGEPTTGVVTIVIEGGAAGGAVPPPAVAGANPVTARADRASLGEAESLITIGVLQNDSATFDGLEIAGIDDAAAEGTVRVVNGGTAIEYDATGAFLGLGAGEEGVDSFTYTITDRFGITDTAVVEVTVLGENDRPFAVDTTQRTAPGETIFFAPTIVDPDGDIGEIAAVSSSLLGGQVEILSERVIAYTPGDGADDLAPGERQVDRFDFLFSDGNGASDTGTVTVVVSAPNGGLARLEGGAENDVFELDGSEARGAIDGAGGEDIVVLPGTLADYVFEPIEGGHRAHPVTDAAGASAQDLFGVERLVFDDADLLVVDDPDLTAIAFFYHLTYARAPDLGGLSFWWDAHQAGQSLGAIGDAFAAAPEFDEIFGVGATNASFVEALYDRGLGRGSDTDGIAHWTGQLDAGVLDKGDVITAFAMSDEIYVRHENSVDDGLLVIG